AQNGSAGERIEQVFGQLDEIRDVHAAVAAVALVELFGLEVLARGVGDDVAAHHLLYEVARGALRTHRGRRRGRGSSTCVLAIDAGDLAPQLRELLLNVHAPFLCLLSNIVGSGSK